MKNIILKIITFLAFFYHIYPQALDVVGRSYIIVAGPLGLAFYLYHRAPFRKEILSLLLIYGAFVFCIYTSGYLNDTFSPFIDSYTRSQMAWLFSAYFCMLLLFTTHKNPTIETLAYYVTFVMLAQAVISVAMTLDDTIRSFFISLQLKVDLSELKMDMSEGQRIVGYGTAFFGAGAVYGYGLIFTAYLLAKAKLDKIRFLLLAAAYCFIFFIGLYSARTTVTGMAISLTMIGVLYLMDHRTEKKKIISLVFIMVIFATIAYSLTLIYFPTMSDWAFELFTNFIESGSFKTRSSNDISSMFVLPQSFEDMLYGTGSFMFFGSDVGYSRLLFFVGYPGTIIFFLYQMSFIKISLTKDWTVNILGFALIVQLFVLNIKGWIDLTFLGTLYFMFFAFYKYYIFQPKLYMRRKIQKANQQYTNKVSDR